MPPPVSGASWLAIVWLIAAVAKGDEVAFERLYREAPMLMIGEGTADIQRMIIGRRLLDGAPTVRIFGEEFPVRARIARLEGSSGHADQSELLAWSQAVCRQGTVRQIALVHCEPESASAFRQLLATHNLPPAIIPARGDELVLE